MNSKYVFFSIIAMCETWFKEDNSNLIDIPNFSLINVPRLNRKVLVLLFIFTILFPLKLEMMFPILNQFFLKLLIVLPKTLLLAMFTVFTVPISIYLIQICRVALILFLLETNLCLILSF